MTMHLDIEAARITHRRPGAVPPPQAGAGRVAVAAPRVWANQQLPARVLNRRETIKSMSSQRTCSFSYQLCSLEVGQRGAVEGQGVDRAVRRRLRLRPGPGPGEGLRRTMARCV